MLGRTGIEVSVIGLGCWAMGGYYWGKTDEGELATAIGAAVDAGVTLFDTADSYGFGRSEGLLGNALHGKRERVVLTSKVGLVWDEGEKFGRTQLMEMEKGIRKDLSRSHILEAVEGSLRRLRTDYLDLYLLHWPDVGTPVEESLGAMEELVRSGKVRAVGVSNFDAEDVARADAVYPIACNQVPLSIFLGRGQAEAIDACRAAGVGVTAYWALHKGLLTGKYGAQARFGSDDWRHYDPEFQGEPYARRVRVVEKLKGLAAELGVSMSALALGWVIAQPGVTAALVGAKTPAQARENAGADIELDAETLRKIDQIAQEVTQETEGA
ncbi:MAG: aldo/keto reductase [Planctomycetota bacterium]